MWWRRGWAATFGSREAINLSHLMTVYENVGLHCRQRKTCISWLLRPQSRNKGPQGRPCETKKGAHSLWPDSLECLHTHGPGWPRSYRWSAALGPPGHAPARTRSTSSACADRRQCDGVAGVAGAQGWALQHLCMRWISHLYDFWSKSRCKSETAKTVKLQQQILSLSGLKNQSVEFGASTATGEHVGNPGEDTARTGEGPLCILSPRLCWPPNATGTGQATVALPRLKELNLDVSYPPCKRHGIWSLSSATCTACLTEKISTLWRHRKKSKVAVTLTRDGIESKTTRHTKKQESKTILNMHVPNRISHFIQQKIDRIKRTDNSKRTVEDFKFTSLTHKTNRLKMSKAI